MRIEFLNTFLKSYILRVPIEAKSFPSWYIFLNKYLVDYSMDFENKKNFSSEMILVNLENPVRPNDMFGVVY